MNPELTYTMFSDTTGRQTLEKPFG